MSITNVQMVAPAADDFIFEDQDSVYTIGENDDYEEGNNQNPTIYVMRGQTYSFRNNSEDHPLRLSRKEAQRDDPGQGTGKGCYQLKKMNPFHGRFRMMHRTSIITTPKPMTLCEVIKLLDKTVAIPMMLICLLSF